MVNGKINNILIPNVTQIPSQKNSVNNKVNNAESSEFKNLLETKIDDSAERENSNLNSLQLKQDLKLSTHALRRLQERNISLDKDEYQKLQSAVEKLKTKGGQDSLIITEKGAYIVDVPKSMIVTAIDKENIGENVFTKIDSTILMN